jgi:glycine/D-amino acid oxidase-like deaminating enzyme
MAHRRQPACKLSLEGKSTVALPEQVEVAVIGAGLVGAAAAYHWSKEGASSLVILEMHDPASGAGGRNAGVVTMGMTPDEFPVIGLMDGKRLYIVDGLAGSGSGVSFLGARHVVRKILGKEDVDYYPEKYFSPMRFIKDRS